MTLSAPPPSRPTSVEDDVLSGGGDLGARMRAIDWSKTPLGPVASWPPSLKTSVRILLTSRQPMFVWWGDDLINLYNDAYTSILGGKHPDALARPAPVVWREIWDQVGPRAAACMDRDEGTYDEALLLIMERNGYPEETYYTFSYSPVRNEDGGTGGIFCANTDDTARILGERQVASLREQALRTFRARSVDDSCASSAHALAINPRDIPFALIYLLDRDAERFSLRGMTGMERGHAAAPETIPLRSGSGTWLWPLGEVFATGQEQVIALDHSLGELPSGPWPRPPVTAVALPLRRPGERPVAGAVVIGLNPFRLYDESYQAFLELLVGQIGASIAGAQSLEDERRRHEAIAELDRAKTAFFSNVSHEFRTPLTLMLAPLEDMRAAESLDSEQRERVELLHRNAARLLKLVNNLLDFARIEAGRAQAAYERVDLGTLTADLASTFRTTIERAGLLFEVESPPLGETVYADRGMWEKIVLNLLSNAFKFTFDGSIVVRVRASAGNQVELEVKDTGTGIPASALPRLFERFHRVEGARSRSHEGSGIGLALVHELVRMHGGTIDVRSTEGVGTTFTIRIPTGSAHLVAERVRHEPAHAPSSETASAYVEEALRWGSSVTGATPPSHPEQTAQPTGTRARILVADDNADMREYLARLLRAHWDVETVADGNEALRAIRRRRPDLVVSDMMMPGIDGFALLRALRSDPELRATPFILLSARAGEEATAEGLAAGADDYIVKPFGARDLLVRVAARLQAARGARAIDDERQRLYRHFMQAPFSVAILRGPELVVELANESILLNWGKDVDVVGKTFHEALPELKDQPFFDLLQGVYRTGLAYEGRAQLARLPVGPGGALKDTYWNFVYVPLADADGAIEAVMVSAFNVTDQIEATRALEDANRTKDLFLGRAAHLQATASELVRAIDTAHLARLFAASDPTAPFDAYGCVIYLRAGDVLKRLAATRHIEEWSRVWDGQELAANPGFREAILAQAPIWIEDQRTLEARYPSMRGRTNPKSSGRALIPLLAAGECIGVFCVAFSGRREFAEDERAYLTAVADLWGQALHRARLAEAEREALGRALEAETIATRKKDEFMAMLGHELRNPLAPIVTATSLIRMRGRSSTRELDTLDRQSRHLVRLVDDLLDISRITSGKLTLDRAPVDLSDVVGQAVESTAQGFESRGVRLHAATGGPAVIVDGDRDRLVQVITNLLVNAAKFTPPGNAVHLAARVAGAEGVIEVRDEGVGIDAGLLPKIFDVFTQGEQASDRRSGGLGLGLAIARSIVTAHGGRIHAASAGLGEGTTFEVRLPLLTATSHSARPSPGAPELRAPASKRRLLVVDDNRDGAEMIADYLGEIGYDPVIALDAQQALSLLRTAPAELALLDIGLPEMDGYQLARAIVTEFGELAPKLIAMTGYAQASDRARALEAGFAEHVAKPVDIQRLAKTIERMLG